MNTTRRETEQVENAKTLLLLVFFCVAFPLSAMVGNRERQHLSQLDPEQVIAVDGVSLGMPWTSVLRLLGRPARTEGSRERSVCFWSKRQVIEFKDGAVVNVVGTGLSQRGGACLVQGLSGHDVEALLARVGPSPEDRKIMPLPLIPGFAASPYDSAHAEHFWTSRGREFLPYCVTVHYNIAHRLEAVELGYLQTAPLVRGSVDGTR